MVKDIEFFVKIINLKDEDDLSKFKEIKELHLSTDDLFAFFFIREVPDKKSIEDFENQFCSIEDIANKHININETQMFNFIKEVSSLMRKFIKRCIKYNLPIRVYIYNIINLEVPFYLTREDRRYFVKMLKIENHMEFKKFIEYLEFEELVIEDDNPNKELLLDCIEYNSKYIRR